MPDHDPTSPWTRQAHHAYGAPTDGPSAPEQPAHAWVSADPYGGTVSAPGAYLTSPAMSPAPVYAGPPIEVRVSAPAAPGRGLAVTGVVLGGLALLGVVVIGFFALFAVVGSFIDDPGGGGGYGPLRGTIAPVTGSALTGPALADEVTKQVLNDGGSPEGLTCPATAKVAQDVTTVCHGMDDGVDSAFVVFFEDGLGSYTLLEV